jgi:DNA-binding CsgD family transcriptional regulator
MEASCLSTSIEAASSNHVELGVIVLKPSNELLYRNQQARVLCEQINQYENVKAASGVLPGAVRCLAEEIRRLLRIRTESKDWEQIQLRRVVGNPDRPVQLCGFGLIDADLGKSRIVIALQETSPAYWHQRILDCAKEKFQLTTRETDILQQLMKGWTNKEIAIALQVSEQTVKEHIKHLLAKTGITTRTGIVMKAVVCGLQYETGMAPSDSLDYACVSSTPQVESQPNSPHYEAPSRNGRPRSLEKIPLLAGNGRDQIRSTNHVSITKPMSLWCQET